LQDGQLLGVDGADGDWQPLKVLEHKHGIKVAVAVLTRPA
jgi:hypothetical protein